MREMVRDYFGEPEEFVGNIATDWGNQHEADLIAEYEMVKGLKVARAGDQQQLVMHPSVSVMGVTPDGVVLDDDGNVVGVVEGKCPFRAGYSTIGQRPDYEVQLRAEIDSTGAKWGDFVVWTTEGIYPPSRITYDPDWLPTVLPAVMEFMEEYRATIASEKLSAPFRAPLVDHRTDSAWQLASLDYLECIAARDIANQHAEEAKKILIELAGEQKKTRGCGVLLTRSTPKGATKYKEALEKYAPDADLTPFRSGGGKPTWTARKAAAS